MNRHTTPRPSRLRTLALAALAAVALGASLGCDPAETFGVDDVTRLTIEAQVPVLVHLPSEALPASPVALDLPVVAPLQVDVLGALREAGANAEADLIKQYRQKAERIEVVGLEYEVQEPNGLPYDVEAIELLVGPYTLAPDPQAAFPVGVTLPVPAGRAIATRDVIYAADGLRAVEVMMQPLAFTLYSRTVVHVPADAPVAPNQLTIRLNMKLRVHVDLAR